MTRPSNRQPMAEGVEARSDRRCDTGLMPYAPPRIERFAKLDEVVRFGGSMQNDSGSLGNQPQPGRPMPS